MPKVDNMPTVWHRAPHTSAKHDVLKRYFGAWFGILDPCHRRLKVIDGGREGGSDPRNRLVSPVLALRGRTA